MAIDRVLETGTEKMLAHVEGGIGWMTYNNPERRNAMSSEMVLAVPRILEAFQDDPTVHVIVVQGAGDKAFVSGADISEFGEKRTDPGARAEYDRRAGTAFSAWERVDKPVVAMIRGFCMGGGLIVAMSTDIRIAAEGSQFGVPAARLGVGYAFGRVQQLVRLVGPAWAAEILFSGRRLSAEEALRIGLVNRVVPPDTLEAEVRALAETIASNAPLTIRAAKVAIREAGRAEADRDVAAVDALVEACFRSEDYKEGQAAFLAKRAPNFAGR
jgi:enoyl-CoA hydratase/carnithine racemase